jgi:hypothetical protein
MPERTTPLRNEPQSNSKALWIVAGVALVAAGGLALYYVNRPAPPAPPPPVVAAPPAPAAAPPAPAVQYPVEPTAAALPALKESDPLVRERLAGVLGAKPVADYVIAQSLARRLVATIDNLPREKIATNLSPVKPVSGRFTARGSGESLAVAPENARRYAPYVKVLQAVDAEQAAAAYRSIYPLLQQAYEELGYPNRYFNDRLIEVIDHLLETPEPAGPLKLMQPKVFYEFLDPDLQSRSAGQKILLRMGRDHTLTVKAKLRELRAALVRLPAAPR